VGRSFLVRIKLDTLRANLSAADGEAYTRADVRQWLLDAGFQSAGEWWRVNESGLLLDTVEVLEAMPEAEVRRKVRVA
jgi:hypothetical protein